MAKKIDSAVENGIGMFLFDWYWYASPKIKRVPDLQGKSGGTFLAGALEEGFLKAPNNKKMEFALMWANQDWVDVHPAKLGWHATGRHGPDVPTVGPTVDPQMLLMFDGFLSPTVYRNAFTYIASTYFTEPNYYRAPTKLANGTTAMCCFFSIYQPAYVASGNETLAAELMDDFRAAAEAVGQCLHLNHMSGGASKESTVARKVSSMTAYGWVKFGKGPKYTFPHTPYEIVAEHAWEQNLLNEKKYAAAPYEIPFCPVLSVGWDSSPRTLPSDAWGEFGYPWGISWGSNVSQWTKQLHVAKDHMSTLCPDSSKWCPPMIINAWNEWSEGAYLEPDVEFGSKKLEAIKAVFGGPATPRRWESSSSSSSSSSLQHWDAAPLSSAMGL
jgi:hypothetical protein